MKIYDCCCFLNELDVLEIRINELKDVVDKFIICESYKTHSGIDKPLNFVNNKKRFEKYENKIIYIATTSISDNPWRNEFNQRNALASQFNNINDNDIILLSDLDEIPNKETLKNLNVEDGKIYDMMQKIYYYYLNVHCINDCWPGTQVFTKKTFIESGNCLTEIRRPNNRGFQSKPCNVPKVNVDNGGWHFSYLGGTEKVKEKMKSFMHQEMVNPKNLNNVENIINDLKWLYDEYCVGNGRSSKIDLKLVEIDQSYPKYLVDNLDRYKHLIKE